METDGYKIRDQSRAHFVTFTVVDWLDVFTRKCYKDIIVDSLRFCIENKGMVLYGYVVMSNHVHLVLQSDFGDLSGLIRDFKKYTSKKIVAKIIEGPESRKEWMLDRFRMATNGHKRNKEHQFWRYGNHPEEIFSQKFLWTKLDYIHLNPVRADIVNRASHYVYSSASNYVNGEGLLEVTLAENPVVNVLTDHQFWKSISW